MHWLFKILAGTCAFATTFQSINACTAFQLKSQDGASVYCRSMEFGVDLKSKILIAPKGSEYKGTAPDNQTGLQWKSKYGFVGINQWISPKFVSDGMNEKGLVVGVLYLPGFAEYEKPDAKQTDKTLGAWELASYLLGTCASLEDVKTSLQNILVAQQPLPGINFSLPFHFYIGDSQGNVLIVEYVKGKRFEHDNPIGVLTNSPPLDWHLNNLSNFVNLSPLNVPELDLKSEKIKLIGEGSGLLGIPGDYTPPSRFVRAALYSQWASSPKNASETARLGFHILNTFDIFDGIVREKVGGKIPSISSELLSHINIQNHEVKEYTQWTVVHDRTNLKTYFRTYGSLQVQMVDLKKLNFSEPGFKQIEMQDNFIVDDVTSNGKPMKS